MVIAFITLASTITITLMFLHSRANYSEQLEAPSQLSKTAKGTIEYTTMGEQEKASHNLLILHGTPGGYDAGMILANWLDLDDDTHVIIPSRPGYLRTPIKVGLTPAAAADAMIALLDELDIDKVTVLGWSGGGPTAVQLAQRHPNRVEKMILLSARIKNDGKYVFEESDESELPFDTSNVDISNSFFGPDFKKFAQMQGFNLMPDFLLYDYFPEQTAHIQLTVDRLRQSASTTMPPSRRNMGRQNDYWQFASLAEQPVINIDMPTLLIYSDSDLSVGYEHGEYINKAIVNSELITVKNETHFSVLTEQVAKKINVFLHSENVNELTSSDSG